MDYISMQTIYLIGGVIIGAGLLVTAASFLITHKGKHDSRRSGKKDV